jgi:hypothetical protein
MSTATITTTALYGVLSEKLGREQAKMVIDYVDAKVDKSIEEKTKILATKDDIIGLKGDIISLQRWIIGIFVTLSIMILGLYATILLK